MSRENEKCYRRWIFDGNHYKGQKRPKMHFPDGKKMSLEKAFDVIVAGLLDGKGLHPSVDYIWYAEKLSVECNVHINLVRQVLHKLNLEGCCSKRKLWNTHYWGGAMHTRLDPHGDDPVQWEGKRYSIDLKKLKEKFG